MSNKNYSFYVITDEDGGVVDVKHDKYDGLKGVFRTKEYAQKVIDENPGVGGLRVIAVNITAK